MFYGVILVIVSLFMRYLYASYQPQPILNADSYGYYGLGRQIVERPILSSFVNRYRVPVYPSILGGLAFVNNKLNTALDDPSFRPVLDQLILIQSLLAATGIILVYLLLLQASVPVVWSFCISLFLSLNVYAYPLERAVMTDSLAGTFLIGLMYLLIRLVQKPTMRKYIFFGVLSTISWLLRPNLLLVPLLSLPLLLFMKTNRKLVAINIVICIVSLLPPIMFALANVRYHGYSGISQATEIALLGRILEFNLPVDAGKESGTYYRSVLDYRTKHGEPLPFQFIDSYTPLAYVDARLMMDLQRFDRAVIAANFPLYMVNVMSYIPNIFADRSPMLAIEGKEFRGLAGVFLFLWQVYRVFWHVGYLVLFLWPVSVLLFFKTPSVQRIIPVLLGTISVSQLLVIVFFDYYEPGQYARLATAIQPPAYLFLVLMGWLYVFRARDEKV